MHEQSGAGGAEEAVSLVSAAASGLGESPLWHAPSASLLWVDISGRALHCLDTRAGTQCSWPLPEEPGCIALVARDTDDAPGPAEVVKRPAGVVERPAEVAKRPAEVVIALRSGFHRFDLESKVLTRVSDPLFDTGRYRFNDGKVDPAGRFWAGTMFEAKTEASGGLYCLECGQARTVTGAGAAKAPWRDWGVTTSNGLAFSPDGRTMYHSDTPAHVVYAYDFDAGSGAIADRRTWWHADSNRHAPDYGGRPDGAAVDAEGCYWTAQYEGGRVLQLSPDGEVVRALPVPARCPTMVAFGGPDLKTLYITSAREGRSAAELREWPASGSVFALQVAVAGLPVNAYVP